MCVKNTKPAKQELGDLCLQDNLTHCLYQQVCWRKHPHRRLMILYKKICCKSTNNEWKGSHNKVVWLWFVLMQDSSRQLESDSTSWQRTLKNFRNLQNQWHVVSALCQKMKNHLTRKVGFEWKSKLGRVRNHNQLPARWKWSGNQNWMCKQRQFSLVGQNFSWLEQVGHRFEQQGWQQRAGNFWDESWRICVENECSCFCEPIKGQSTTTKTHLWLLIHKNCAYLWKILDWCRVSNSFACRLPSVKTTKQSSSWWSTSRKRWSDWILDIKRLSSERIWLLSIFVWWCVEKQDDRRRRQQEKISIFFWSIKTRNSLFPIFQGHSGRNLIDLSLQDNILIPNNFFVDTYHIGCAINLHSQNLSKLHTIFFKFVHPVNKEHKDPSHIDLDATTFWMIHAESRKTSRHCALGRFKTCSTEKI